MIIGIGIDLIEIDRFTKWTTFTQERLLKVFTLQEIRYSFSDPALTAARLAARFAAKEAFFKALSSAYPEIKLSLMQLCPLIEVTKTLNETPQIQFGSLLLSEKTKNTHNLMDIKTHLSLTHSSLIAGAFVILEH